MKFLLDMNISPLWLHHLIAAGFEVEHWSKIGEAFAADGEIMDYARLNGLIIFTQDLDFGISLALTGASTPSVVQLRSDDVLPFGIGDRVVDVIKQIELELMQGALVTIDPKRTRVRVLPLQRS